jgi:hypothetical protein
MVSCDYCERDLVNEAFNPTKSIICCRACFNKRIKRYWKINGVKSLGIKEMQYAFDLKGIQSKLI